MKRSTLALAGSVALCAGVSVTQADLINIQSNTGASSEGLGSFTGTVNYTPITSTTASLVITLTNTSSNGGFITALALVSTLNAGGMSLSFVSASDPDFGGLSNPTSASPFGDYIGGASTSSSWTGGGSPSLGVGVGSTGTFTFSVTAPNANALSAGFFVNQANGRFNMVVRMRGFNDGGSDKIPGQIVPTPSAAAALGLGGLLAMRRRR